MIVAMQPSHCGNCGHVLEYKQVSDAPHGLVFWCDNGACLFRGQLHQVPQLRCEHYYPTPCLLVKHDRTAA